MRAAGGGVEGGEGPPGLQTGRVVRGRVVAVGLEGTGDWRQQHRTRCKTGTLRWASRPGPVMDGARNVALRCR